MSTQTDAAAALERYRLMGVEEKGRELGQSYGATVVEVTYAGLRCVAKKIRHLETEEEVETKDLLPRMAHECRILSQLRHPNVVQFMGVSYLKGGSDIPALVSEYLPMSLSRCIEQYGVLPEDVGYSILEDVALGLRYLHGLIPSIVHGSLSAYSVLLTRDMRAKIDDVGVSHLVPTTGLDLEKELESCYIAPEVPINQAAQSKAANVFSYGVLVIHVLCGRVPIPVEALISPGSDSDSLLSASLAYVPSLSRSFSESTSREEYLSEIGDDHPLMELILRCISEYPAHRPEASEIHHKVHTLTSNHPPSELANSLEMRRQMQSIAEEREELQLKAERLTMQSSNHRKAASELECLRQKVARLSAQNIALRASLSARNGTAIASASTRSGDSTDCGCHTCPLSPSQLCQGKLHWTQCASIPVGMFQAQGVVIGEKVYVGGGVTSDTSSDHLVFEYDTRDDKWAVLPPAPTTLFGVGQLEGELIIVGGKDGLKISNSVYNFDRFTRRWKDSLPKLSNAQYAPTVISQQSCLLVTAGIHKNAIGELAVVNAVEVINTENFQWYTASYLPRSACLSFQSTTTVDDNCYTAGGYKSLAAPSASKSAHSASLSLLLSTCSRTPYSWHRLPQLPQLQSTVANLRGCLLALGGTTNSYTLPVESSVHTYCPETESWVPVGSLPYPCCHCTAVTLPSGEVLVVGGWVQPGEEKRSPSVYRGNVLL